MDQNKSPYKFEQFILNCDSFVLKTNDLSQSVPVLLKRPQLKKWVEKDTIKEKVANETFKYCGKKNNYKYIDDDLFNLVINIMNDGNFGMLANLNDADFINAFSTDEKELISIAIVTSPTLYMDPDYAANFLYVSPPILLLNESVEAMLKKEKCIFDKIKEEKCFLGESAIRAQIQHDIIFEKLNELEEERFMKKRNGFKSLVSKFTKDFGSYKLCVENKVNLTPFQNHYIDIMAKKETRDLRKWFDTVGVEFVDKMFKYCGKENIYKQHIDDDLFNLVNNIGNVNDTDTLGMFITKDFITGFKLKEERELIATIIIESYSMIPLIINPCYKEDKALGRHLVNVFDILSNNGDFDIIYNLHRVSNACSGTYKELIKKYEEKVYKEYRYKEKNKENEKEIKKEILTTIQRGLITTTLEDYKGSEKNKYIDASKQLESSNNEFFENFGKQIIRLICEKNLTPVELNKFIEKSKNEFYGIIGTMALQTVRDTILKMDIFKDIKKELVVNKNIDQINNEKDLFDILFESDNENWIDLSKYNEEDQNIILNTIFRKMSELVKENKTDCKNISEPLMNKIDAEMKESNINKDVYSWKIENIEKMREELEEEKRKEEKLKEKELEEKRQKELENVRLQITLEPIDIGGTLESQTPQIEPIKIPEVPESVKKLKLVLDKISTTKNKNDLSSMLFNSSNENWINLKDYKNFGDQNRIIINVFRKLSVFKCADNNVFRSLKDKINTEIENSNSSKMRFLEEIDSRIQTKVENNKIGFLKEVDSQIQIKIERSAPTFYDESSMRKMTLEDETDDLELPEILYQFLGKFVEMDTIDEISNLLFNSDFNLNNYDDEGSHTTLHNVIHSIIYRLNELKLYYNCDCVSVFEKLKEKINEEIKETNPYKNEYLQEIENLKNEKMPECAQTPQTEPIKISEPILNKIDKINDIDEMSRNLFPDNSKSMSVLDMLKDEFNLESYNNSIIQNKIVKAILKKVSTFNCTTTRILELLNKFEKKVSKEVMFTNCFKSQYLKNIRNAISDTTKSKLANLSNANNEMSKNIEKKMGPACAPEISDLD